MKSTMDLSNQKIEHDSMGTEYDDDILYAGWNPEVGLASQQLQISPTTELLDMPVAPTTKAVELFLIKMYSFLR